MAVRNINGMNTSHEQISVMFRILRYSPRLQRHRRKQKSNGSYLCVLPDLTGTWINTTIPQKRWIAVTLGTTKTVFDLSNRRICQVQASEIRHIAEMGSLFKNVDITSLLKFVNLSYETLWSWKSVLFGLVLKVSVSDEKLRLALPSIQDLHNHSMRSVIFARPSRDVWRTEGNSCNSVQTP